MPGRILRAVIYLAGRAARRREADCLAHVEHHGYQLDSVFHDDSDGVRFSEIAALALAGQVDIVVTPSLSMLPVDRTPRIETLDDPPVRRPTPLFRRRPRRLD